ncbi:sugar transferase [Hydrocarboniphaga sp.]|uniref:sugar transferase n=1 Tax=Hydrocarboniphaga sp. TaxID=2033016 RepID=UPI003D0BCF4C
MLARTQVLAVHSASDKLLHYVRLRVHEATLNQSYRAGLFVPASQIESVLFDMALIYDAMLSAPDKDYNLQARFATVCAVAAEELRGHRSELEGGEIAARALSIHERQLGNASTLSGLTVAIEASLLRPLSPRNELSNRQRRLRHDLALVLSLEAQVVRSSALSALGVPVDLSTLVDDRDQHLYLFCDRYGCLNKSELGEDADLIGEEADSAPVPNELLKRLLDIVAVSFILLMLSPVFLFLFIAIKSEGGTAFYNQRRVGQHGRLFRCWKFRTMVPNAEQLLEKILASDPAAQAEYAQFFKLRNDPRITRIGRVLRKTSLDELPQLFNVLIGEMSLVGPRPIAVDERDRWGSYFRLYKRLRPGLTGPWQLYFRSDHPYDDQFEHAVRYATEWSFWKDLWYLIETVAVPFRQRGAY